MEGTLTCLKFFLCWVGWVWADLPLELGYQSFKWTVWRCLLSTWILTCSYCRAIWIAMARLRSDFRCSFCEADLSEIPITILSWIFFLHPSMKACSFVDNISLGYEVFIKLLYNLCVFLFVTISKCECVEYVFCLCSYWVDVCINFQNFIFLI